MRGPAQLRQEDFETMLVEVRDDGVAVVTLNRPERHNAVTNIMHRELTELPTTLHEDGRVRAVVITGAGRSFCSGADVAALDPRHQPSQYDLMMFEARKIVMDFLALDKPVITAVKGYALGLGCTVALLGDVIMAGESARFGDTHVNIGYTAGDGGAVVWPLLMGMRAKYYLLTGDHVPAAEAYRLGLVHRVVPDEQLLEESLAIATRLAAGPPVAIRTTKASINRFMAQVANEVLPFSLAVETIAMNTEDAAEAQRAFMEKRPASFTGR
jgi:enoyl-CoA hydratase